MNSLFIPYQTANDLLREKKIITFLSERWRFEYEKLGDFSVFDFACWRDNQIVAYIEVKTKKAPYVDYDTYICTTQDIDYGLKLSKEKNIPAFLVVKWPDYFGYLRITRNNYASRKSGQKNRNDPRDYDTLCYLIPREEFREIRGFDFNE